MGSKVLFVDDDATTQTMVRTSLEKSGFNVMVAHNGKDALMKIKFRQPDIIVTDVLMPDVDGIDLLNTIRENPATRKIPVIIITSSTKMEEGFRRVGVAEFIAKPFKMEDLVAKINMHIPAAAPDADK